jgi:hypothetical protein
MADKDTILNFLNQDVPYSNTEGWNIWQENCNRLGKESIPILIDCLKTGLENTHYPSLLALRMFGYEAWANGDGKKRTYRVKAPSDQDWTIIVPLHPPLDWDDPDNNWMVLTKGRG